MTKPPHTLCDAPNLAHLRRLTTTIGIWQHTIGKEPDIANGYSIDDIARALIVVNTTARVFPIMSGAAENDPRTLADLADVYLTFLEKQQLPTGEFHNFVDAHGRALDTVGSDDSFGRTVWALCHTIAHGIRDEHKTRARKLFENARQHIQPHAYARTNAFLLLGLTCLPQEVWDDELRVSAKEMVAAMCSAFTHHTHDTWQWFETVLTYSNGALPLALFLASDIPVFSAEEKQEITHVAEQAFAFLLRETTIDGVPAPIGNKGWYQVGEEKAMYDQQPVDAAAMVLASLAAWRVTKNELYKKTAEEWLRWYEGNNVRKESLVEEDGTVHDGINDGWVNPNAGAESVITYLLARLTWKEYCC